MLFVNVFLYCFLSFLCTLFGWIHRCNCKKTLIHNTAQSLPLTLDWSCSLAKETLWYEQRTISNIKIFKVWTEPHHRHKSWWQRRRRWLYLTLYLSTAIAVRVKILAFTLRFWNFERYSNVELFQDIPMLGKIDLFLHFLMHGNVFSTPKVSWVLCKRVLGIN